MKLANTEAYIARSTYPKHNRISGNNNANHHMMIRMTVLRLKRFMFFTNRIVFVRVGRG
jgi:hypothetical protein